jgi:hypothetical protein
MDENSTTEDTSEEKQVQYTDEQLETMRQETIKFYTSKNEVLALQADHERYLAEIEESQLRQITAVSRKLQIMAPSPQPETPEPNAESENSEEKTEENRGPRKPKKPRNLKKD